MAKPRFYTLDELERYAAKHDWVLVYTGLQHKGVSIDKYLTPQGNIVNITYDQDNHIGDVYTTTSHD